MLSNQLVIDMKKIDLICIGNPAVDIVNSNGRTFINAGGPEMNTAVSFTQLGGTSGIIGIIGKDKYGKFLLSELKKHQIDFSRLRINKKSTHLVKITVTPKERIIKMLNPHYNTKLSSADEKYIKDSHAVYVRLVVKNFLECAKIATKLKKNFYIIFAVF